MWWKVDWHGFDLLHGNWMQDFQWLSQHSLQEQQHWVWLQNYVVYKLRQLDFLSTRLIWLIVITFMWGVGSIWHKISSSEHVSSRQASSLSICCMCFLIITFGKIPLNYSSWKKWNSRIWALKNSSVEKYSKPQSSKSLTLAAEWVKIL